MKGKILYTTWGYNMTIVDFYEVIKETPKGVKVRQLESTETPTGYLCGTCVPKRKEGEAKEFHVRKVDADTYKGSLGSSIMHFLYTWEGKPINYNHCD